MALRIETEKAVGPKLRSPLGAPAYKGRGKPHILFPFGQNYRSPKRQTWWPGRRLAYPQHSHQKQWVREQELSLQAFAFVGRPEMAPEPVRQQLPPQQLELHRKKQAEALLKSRLERRAQLCAAREAVASAASAQLRRRRPSIVSEGEEKKIPLGGSNGQVVSVGSRLFDLSAKAALVADHCLPEALHALPLYGGKCLLLRNSRACASAREARLRVEHKKYKETQKARGRGVSLPSPQKTRGGAALSATEEGGKEKEEQKETANGKAEENTESLPRSSLGFVPTSVVFRVSPGSPRELQFSECVPFSQPQEKASLLSFSALQRRPFKAFVSGDLVSLPRLFAASSQNPAGGAKAQQAAPPSAFVFRRNSQPSSLPLGFWSVVPPRDGSRWVYRPSLRLSVLQQRQKEAGKEAGVGCRRV